MHPKIPEPVRSNAINGWLHGLSRDETAKNNGIEAGTVSTIIKVAHKMTQNLITKISSSYSEKRK
jgi:hypothetical protein